MPAIVALDIETTGLDPRKDRVIEIGAVRFNGSVLKRIRDPGQPGIGHPALYHPAERD